MFWPCVSPFCKFCSDIFTPFYLDPSTLSFPRPQSVIVPKVENNLLSTAFTNDSISADQGIVMKSEGRPESDALIGSQVFNEVRPVHQSHIPGYERDAVQERQLQALGNYCSKIEASMKIPF